MTFSQRRYEGAERVKEVERFASKTRPRGERRTLVKIYTRGGFPLAHTKGKR